MIANFPGTRGAKVGCAVPVINGEKEPVVGVSGLVVCVVRVVWEPAPVLAVALTPTFGLEQAPSKRPNPDKRAHGDPVTANRGRIG